MELNQEKGVINKMNLIVLIILYYSLFVPAIDENRLNGSIQSLIVNITILFSTLYFVLVYVKQNSTSYKFDLPLVIPSTQSGKVLLVNWILFSLSAVFSQSYHGELPVSSFGLLIYIPIIYFMIIPKVLKNPNKIITKASFYSSFMHILSSIIIAPDISIFGYRGIYGNPNSLGLIAMVSTISSLTLTIYDKKSNFVVRLVYVMGFILSFFSLFISRNRTSFIAVVASIILLVIYLFRTKNIKLSKIIIPSIIYIYIYIKYLHVFLTDGIFSKFSLASSNSDILSGRELIWSKILNEVTFMGHGAKYFDEQVGIAAHNGVLQYVGWNGIITGVLLLVFLIIVLRAALLYARRSTDNNYILVPMLVVFPFFVITMAETTIAFIGFSYLMIFYNIVGVLMYETKL